MVNLRSQASIQIPVPLKSSVDTSLEINVTLEQLRELVHELEVHKIELELQNEELQSNLKELDKVKEQLADLFEFAPVGYVVLSPTGNILQVNHSCAELLCQSKSQLIGHSVYQFFADEHGDNLFLHLRQVFKDQTQKSYTAEVIRDDGSHFHAKLDSVVHLNEVGSGSAQCLMLISDVSELANSDASNREAKTAAELLNREKSRFLAAASHDLRQPLQAITTINDLLQKTVTDKNSIDNVYKQADSLKDMSELLNTLLNVSQIESGSLSATPKAFPVSDLLHRIGSSYRAPATEKGLDLKVIQSSAIINTDRVLLGEIIDNLISNAIRYTESGKVLIGCRRRGSALRIEVWDTGIGIPADKQEQIFEDFFQIDNLARSRDKGFGLGLSISARIARLLGARLALKSWANGSWFSIELPIDNTSYCATLENPEDTCCDLSATPFKTLLVVDDNAIVLDALVCFLEHEGYTVIGASSMDEVLALLEARTNSIDLIISDFLLPKGETGLDIIKAVRQYVGIGVPGMIITGQPQAVCAVEANALSIPIFQKPVPAERLIGQVEKLLV